MVNLELYRIFYEVAKVSNITIASQNLNISQPAVTKHIKDLENGLGTSLFIRSRKGVILTSAGEKLFLYVKQALDLISYAEKELDDMQNMYKGTLRIGVGTTLTKKYLLKYIKEYHRLYPNITIEISTDPTDELKEKMKLGRIDFIIAKMPPYKDADYQYTTLGVLEDIFIGNESYKELGNRKVSLEQLSEYPILLQKKPSSSREYIDTICHDRNVELKSIMDIASSNLLIDFVKIGYGIGFVTKQYVLKELENNELVEIKLDPPIPPREFGIIELKDNFLSFSAEAMLDLIRKDYEK